MKNASSCFRKLFIVVVCFSLTFVRKVDASEIIETCRLSSYTIHVRFDNDTNSFVKVEQNTDSLRRNLRKVSSRNLESESPIFQAKWCECATHSRGTSRNDYCILNRNENLCYVPVDVNEPVLCSGLSPVEAFVKNAWPISLLWIAALSIYICFTEGGHQICRYACIKIFFCWDSNVWNERLVEELLRNESIEGMQRRHDPNRSTLRNSSVVYLLRMHEYSPTKTKHLSEDGSPLSEKTATMTPDCIGDSNDDLFCSEIDNEEVVCTICIATIEEGDMIGALPCKHRFHVECLKEWLRRKNVCPLCQGPIAVVKNGQNLIENHVANETRLNSLARLLRIRRERRMQNRQSTVGISIRHPNRSIRVGDPARAAVRVPMNAITESQRRVVMSRGNRYSNRELLERRRQYLNDVRRQLNH